MPVVVRRLLEITKFTFTKTTIKNMSANNSTEYLLLFRGTDWDRSLSPAELQKTLGSFMTWFERLGAEGVVKGGQPLADEGRIVTSKTDGPYVESKETIGGYFIINADDLESAVAIAKGCPMLAHGVTVEVRPIALECATTHRAKQRIQEAEELATAGV